MKYDKKRKALIFEDLRLCVEIEDVDGIIHAEQGIVAFFSPERGMVIPLTFFVPAELFEESTTATVETATGRLVSNVENYHVYKDELKPGDVIVTKISSLEKLLEEEKLRNVAKGVPLFFICVGTVIADIVFGRIGFILGFALSTVLFTLSALRLRWLIRCLNSHTIVDKYGNWIDLDSGKSNILMNN